MSTSSFPLLRFLLAMGVMIAVPACDDAPNITSPGFSGGSGFPGKVGPPIGGGSGGFPGGSLVQGREFFLSTAGSSLVQNCAFCHADTRSGAPIFMGADIEESYIMLSLYEGVIAFPDDSSLLQLGTHAGPELASEQKNNVVKWLNLEMGEFSQVTDFEAKTLRQALDEVGKCMEEEDWTANGLDGLATLQTTDGVACSTCHSDGQHGVVINESAAKTFEDNRAVPIINRWVRGKLALSRGQLDDLVPAKILATYGKTSCDPTAFMCHPAYELPPALAAGIDTFTEKVLSRWRLNACPVK